MTSEQAIEILRDMRNYFNDRSHKQYSMPAIELAIQALDKQVATKPTGLSVSFDGRVGNCPSCKKIVRETNVKPNVCRCGQKLDWGATFRFELTAHTEIDIDAENLEEAREEAHDVWRATFSSDLFGDVEFIKVVEDD